MKIYILRYILVLVPEVPQGRPPKVQRACGPMIDWKKNVQKQSCENYKGLLNMKIGYFTSCQRKVIADNILWTYIIQIILFHGLET